MMTMQTMFFIEQVYTPDWIVRHINLYDLKAYIFFGRIVSVTVFLILSGSPGLTYYVTGRKEKLYST